MNSSQAYRLAQVLSDSIGPRLTGTPGIKRGNDWLVATYKSWGVDARNEQYGKWKGWRRGTTHIDLMTPRVRTLEGTLARVERRDRRQGRHGCDGDPAGSRRQQRVRRVAAAGQGQVRARIHAAADLPSRRQLASVRRLGRPSRACARMRDSANTAHGMLASAPPATPSASAPAR